MTEPKISIVTANRNGGRFLQETLDTVSAQTFADFEHIVVDGASSDDSVAILDRHSRRDPRLRWISEPDSSPAEGFRKAIAMARGEYIMVTCASDGYLTRTWFQRCADILDSDRETSLVWGASAVMSEEGDLIDVTPYKYLKRSPPQQREFFRHWVLTSDLVPELNYCVRRSVFLKNYPGAEETDIVAVADPFVAFLYGFHIGGYLVKFLPIIANFGRSHKGQHTEVIAARVVPAMKLYRDRVRQYRTDLITGRKRHVFRDGDHQPLEELSGAALRRLRYIRMGRLADWATAGFRRMVPRLTRSLRKRIKVRTEEGHRQL
jgi:glycosyltransferase involved in cell wall biosynthesis